MGGGDANCDASRKEQSNGNWHFPEALPAVPVVDSDTAFTPLEFQVKAKFPRKTSFPLPSSRRKLKLMPSPIRKEVFMPFLR